MLAIAFPGREIQDENAEICWASCMVQICLLLLYPILA